MIDINDYNYIPKTTGIGTFNKLFGFLKPLKLSFGNISMLYIPKSILDSKNFRNIIMARILDLTLDDFVELVLRIRMRIPICPKQNEISVNSKNKLIHLAEKNTFTYSTLIPLVYRDKKIMYQFGINFFDEYGFPLMIPCYAIPIKENKPLLNIKDLNSLMHTKCISEKLYEKKTMVNKLLDEIYYRSETVLFNQESLNEFIQKEIF